MSEQNCHCGSGRLFKKCCGLLLSGRKQALTAEALVRSRYAAYVEENVTYLLKTWHVSTRPNSIDFTKLPRWRSLVIINTGHGGIRDKQGTVEFKAFYEEGLHLGVLHERSRFVRENGCWYYVDGNMPATDTFLSVNTGRNAPCPCGSGKKFKKCCAGS